MRYAPDKDDPYPRPKPKPTGGGNNNGGGNKSTTIGFDPGRIQQYVNEQMAAYGGDPQKWRDHFRDVYSPIRRPNYSWERRGGGGGNGGKDNDPTKPGTDNGTDTGGGRPDVANPHGKMTMVGQMPAQMAAQMPTQGFLGIPGATGQQLPPTMGLLQRGPANGAQFQLPPEILAMMARR